MSGRRYGVLIGLIVGLACPLGVVVLFLLAVGAVARIPTAWWGVAAAAVLMSAVLGALRTRSS
jgi:hypothetical protein